ncbi:hypothetical protein BAUCODRAFT_149060 [Baudoinia panamericana UAMH 10762]|uniref:EKC/KEOPS complex subunit GON7 n=1 Tax=Baudoinia panamericana (strain UAMH 10762) TaxID=717646 RepID=M2N8A5_BAUPA|nr:uncharacterized protein BAUCODRAFT_149060 [Baudoinia panamericana UAMH 10762]EMC95030.1 hypothetical protein BAUCODRAFT_149060 [Baudoinia panamericana UAMH 10762]
MAVQALTASYLSTSTSKKFAHDLPNLPHESKAQDAEGKTAYLSALRSNSAKMQADINTFLTACMDHDKAAENSKSVRDARRDEEKEEEMYGEEDPEADG